MDHIIDIHDKYSKQYTTCSNLIVFYNENRENLNLIKLLPIIKHYIIENGYLIVLHYDYNIYNTQTDFYNTIIEFAKEARIENLSSYSKCFGNSYSMLMKHHYIYMDKYYEISIYNNYINACITDNNYIIINILYNNLVESIPCNLQKDKLYNIGFAKKLFDIYININIYANMDEYTYNTDIDNTVSDFDNIYDEVIIEMGLQNLYL